MIRFRFALIAVAPFILMGCSASDKKIVDLSGSVFIIYIILIAIKYITPKIAKSQTFITISHAIGNHLKHFVYPLYFLAVGLIGFGYLSSDIINRVHIFTGLIVGIIAHYIGETTKLETIEQKKLSIEIITLGLGILFVLFLLWGLGASLFRDF